jgi:pimeloyl-ACP methyl ester carboxylesterase
MTESTAPATREPVHAGARTSALRAAWPLFVAAALAGAASFGPVRRHVAAATVLAHLSGPAGKAGRPAPGTSSDLVVEGPRASARARLYLPPGRAARCLVVGHGVHYLGIEEPRLVRFASELARVGVAVLTPELADLADYRITRRGADVLAESVHALHARCGVPVGLLGFSFAGGLALLAAEDHWVSRELAYVASVGGYQDLTRVLSFLLTDQVETPDGMVTRKAHEYGIVVLVYENLDWFVPAEDRAVMREAVKAWLHEDRARAWWFASLGTTLRSEQFFEHLASGDSSAFRATLGTAMEGTSGLNNGLSPRGRLDRIPVPVYLLHGAGDRVIPAEETVWGGRELDGHPHAALVSPLIEHVEVSGKPTWRDQWALVDFMSRLL